MKCPHCETDMLAIDLVEGIIKDGDLTFCLECCLPSIFERKGDELILRAPTCKREKLECDIAVSALFEEVTKTMNIKLS